MVQRKIFLMHFLTISVRDEELRHDPAKMLQLAKEYIPLVMRREALSTHL